MFKNVEKKVRIMKNAESLRSYLFSAALLAVLFTAGCGGSSNPTEESANRFEGEAFGLVTSDVGEAWFTVNGDATILVFSRHDENWSNHTIFEVSKSGANWGLPAPAPFSGQFNDRSPRFYPALDALLFSSDRPVNAEDEAGDFNLWVVIHDGEEWLAPEPISALNSDSNDFHASISATGSIYFASSRPGGQGRSDLYRAVLGIEGYEVEALPASLNTANSEADVWVDQDEEYIIFSRTDDPDGYGGDDLWISFLEEDSWSAPQNLGPKVNSAEYEYGAYVSQDKSLLFFTSHHDGDADIMSIPFSSLSIAWPE